MLSSTFPRINSKAGLIQLEEVQSESSTDVQIAHDFLVNARQALVKAQEQPEVQA